MNEVFAASETTVGEVLQAKDATLSTQSDICELHTDQRWLELILKNLVDNAAKFIPQGGQVQIRCRRDNGLAVFEVEDDGCGIPTEDLDRVFERFYQVDKSRSLNQGGTGLGLAIVKHAVLAMHGQVSIRSRVGEGTIVSFRIPAGTPATVNASA